MSSLIFEKMHGLGNDFIVVDGLKTSPTFVPQDIAHLADRYSGIGFDQLLLLLPSQKADLRCQIFNADGSEAEQCGNGMRCVARFVHEAKISEKPVIRIETKAGIIPVEVQDTEYQSLRVNMGSASFAPSSLPLEQQGELLEFISLSLGNPHAIAKVSELATYPLDQVAQALSKHPAFPQGVNVGLIEVLSKNRLRLRTFERGVGETRACGSNASAAACAAITQGWVQSPVEVEVQGGRLQVEWQGEHTPVFLTGPASRVYRGELF